MLLLLLVIGALRGTDTVGRALGGNKLFACASAMNIYKFLQRDSGLALDGSFLVAPLIPMNPPEINQD